MVRWQNYIMKCCLWSDIAYQWYLAVMKSLSNLTPIFFVFFTFHHICHFRTATSTESTALCTSLDNITLINCGNSGVSTAWDGRDWTGDVNSEFCSFEEHGKESKLSRTTARGDVVPYTTVRMFPFQFTYIFRVHPGQKFVRLHFNPVSYRGFDRSKAIFTVKSGLLKYWVLYYMSNVVQERAFI